MKHPSVLLAVYGTLTSRHGNHGILGEDAKVIAKGIRLPGFSLYDVSNGYFPGVVRDTDGPGVEVEVVEVPEKMIPTVDSYEGYPNLYDKELVKLPNGDEAWIYTYNYSVRDKPLIVSGRWEPKPR